MFERFALGAGFLAIVALPAYGAATTPAVSPTPRSVTQPSSDFDPAATPTPGFVPASGAATIVLLPGGTNVSVSLSEPISSNSANVGDTVPTTVDKEVDAAGYVAIPKGANGQATVTVVDHAGGNGHGGKLGLQMDWVYSADHGKILLSQVNHAAGDDTDQKGAASTATILSYVLLGPLGLFAHNFVHGKDVTVPTTQVFKVFVDHDVHVKATDKAQAPAGFDD